MPESWLLVILALLIEECARLKIMSHSDRALAYLFLPYDTEDKLLKDFLGIEY